MINTYYPINNHYFGVFPPFRSLSPSSPVATKALPGYARYWQQLPPRGTPGGWAPMIKKVELPKENMQKYGKMMERYGKLWKHLGKYGKIMETYWNIWKKWKHIGKYKNMMGTWWKNMGTYGKKWKHMETIWETIKKIWEKIGQLWFNERKTCCICMLL